MAINFLEGVTTPTITATTLTVSGGTLAVTGTFWQATQPVSGTVAISGTVPVSFTQTGLTDTELRATAVPVSLASVPTHGVTGTFWQATQPVSIASMPSTPVTGTFWQATQPVSGTVTAAVNDSAIARTADPTAVSAAAAVNMLADTVGRQVVMPYSLRANAKSKYTACTTTGATTVVVAGGAGIFTDLMNITILNGTATASNVTLSDGTNSYVYPIAGAIGAGVQISLTNPRRATTANVAWTVAMSVAVTSMHVTIDYFLTAV